MKKVVLILIFLLGVTGYSFSQKFNEMINLGKYADDNAKLLTSKSKNKNRVVFIGNSITEGWVQLRPKFFSSNNYIGRGIGGQTSPQLLSRFRQDVINLHPAIVVINIGTNDIAENTGAYDEDFTLGNIKSMAELAEANGIVVILSSVLPVDVYLWSRDIDNVPQKISSLNDKIKAYAKSRDFAYIDYYSKMVTKTKALNPKYGDDGVHPNGEGYKVMEGVAKKVIDKSLKNK